VLAAGASSRLGRPKQLLDLAGRPLLQHVLEAASAGRLDQIVVVLGHAAGEIAAKVHLPAHAGIVVNPDFELGQSTSLRAGLEAATDDCRAAVVLLGDQPGVRPDAIRAVAEAWRRGAGPVVQASYGGRITHPTLLDRSVWAAVRAASGDEGARTVLAQHPDWLATVEVGGTAPDDIDTEGDYDRVKESFEGM
jgi:molybdenum cofactor cytidylyltransferase